jgi:hypothetical protein
MRHSTLTEPQVRKILAELATPNPRTFKAIAAQYGVTRATIGYIYQGRTWQHIERPPVLHRAADQMPCGEDCSSSKLTEAQVREIKALKGTGLSGYAVACRYGVTQSHVSMIWLGKTWKHLEGPQ